MDYMIRFTGHIDEMKRPLNFPKEIYADMYCRAENPQGLANAIREMSKVFVSQQCMVVPKDPGSIEESTYLNWDSRFLVPLHMITHLSITTKSIVGEIPELNGTDTPQLADGTKVRLQ